MDTYLKRNEKRKISQHDVGLNNYELVTHILSDEIGTDKSIIKPSISYTFKQRYTHSFNTYHSSSLSLLSWRSSEDYPDPRPTGKNLNLSSVEIDGRRTDTRAIVNGLLDRTVPTA